MPGISLYLIENGMDDTNLRECFGFYDQASKEKLKNVVNEEMIELLSAKSTLVVWPEEARYLSMKGLVDGSCEIDSGVECFYTREKGEGKFLIRHQDLAELATTPGDAHETQTVVDLETYKDIEQKQQLKRRKLDDRVPSFIVFDYFPDR